MSKAGSFHERENRDILRRIVIVRRGARGCNPERHSFFRVKRRKTKLLAIAEMQARAIIAIRKPGIPGEKDGSVGRLGPKVRVGSVDL